MSDPIFLKTPEAAKRVGLASSTFEKLRCHGDGPTYLRLSPRRVVYAIDTLDAWARAHEFRSTSEYPA
jgi:predicted DNA-binding transcriptional regulator AlpA